MHGKAHAPNLENVLFDWINEKMKTVWKWAKNGARVWISFPKKKRSKLYYSLNNLIAFFEGMGWTLPNQHGRRYWRAHGEFAKANITEYAEQLSAIKEKIGKIQDCNVFYAEEFWLFFRQSLGCSLSVSQMNGLKTDRSRISCLVCCMF